MSAFPLPITAIVLTKNERRNLPACFSSVAGKIARVVVVDSYSDDDTVDIAKSFGASVYQRPWKNYGDQFQWALENVPIETPWVLRLDADERWTEEGFEVLAAALSPEVAGINVRMRIYFMGRFLRHGGLYPNEFLRVFRKEGAHIEQRWMDEHLIVPGRIVSPGIDVVEANYDRQENIGLWTTKHNAYSTREAIDVLAAKWQIGRVETVASLTGGKTARKRWLKEKVYARVPLFVRPAFYFLYRYLFQLGFLDGVPGFVFCVLQGFWYRFLVDVKVYQLERLAKSTGRSLPEVIHDSYGIRIG